MTDQEHQEAETTAHLPALIKKAHTQLTEYLKNGAHILCPMTVTDPPPGFAPKVVCVHINADPDAKEVYIKETGYRDRPAKLELTKIGLLKVADMLGVSWDDERSGRVDSGNNPIEITYKAVGYRLDYQGRRQQITGTKMLNLDAMKDDMVATRVAQVKAWMEKQGTADWEKVPWKWKKAITENRADEVIEQDVRAELLKKRLFMLELAETGAKLRAIRSKGFRTTYTAKELEKDFVDVTMVSIDSAGTLNKAGAAFKQMFGEPRQREQGEPQRAEDVIIETKAKTEPAVMSKESILADFQCCDQSQAMELIVDIAEKKAFPVDEGKMQGMSESAMRNLLLTLLDMPDQKGCAS